MAPRTRWSSRSTFLLGLALGLLLHTFTARADAQMERRMLVGFNMFMTTVHADQELALKLNDQGRKELWILYNTDRQYAEKYVQRLKGDSEYAVRAVSFHDLAKEPVPPPTAMFLAEPAPDRQLVIDYGAKHHRVVFSPFKGDVPQGIPTGIWISDLILPLVNREAVKRAGLRLRPFYFEAAVTKE